MAHPPPPPAEPMKSPVSAPPAPKPATGYDTAPPPALLEFMMQRWRPGASGVAAATPPPPGVRRPAQAALSKLFPGEVLVIPTGAGEGASNDTYYRFRPGTDFYYLTGNLEPDCVLVLLTEAGGGHRDLLFVEPNPGKTDATFFTDRVKGELWVGPRLGVPESQARYRVDRRAGAGRARGHAARRSTARRRALARAARLSAAPWTARCPTQGQPTGCRAGHVPVRNAPDQGRAGGHASCGSAIASTKRGFEDVIRALRGRAERARGRRASSTCARASRATTSATAPSPPPAPTPASCTGRATTAPVQQRRPAAARRRRRGRQLYTADITRTLPISGKFTPRAARRSTTSCRRRPGAPRFAAVQPGQRLPRAQPRGDGGARRGPRARSASCRRPPRRRCAEEHQFYRRYSLHNVSHMLGLDVHDCAQARDGGLQVRQAPKPGMVLTVEPGLYFQTDDLTVPGEVPRHRRAHRGRRPGDGQGDAQPLPGLPERGGSGRGVDGQGVEIPTLRGSPRPLA